MSCKTCEAINQPGALCAECAVKSTITTFNVREKLREVTDEADQLEARAQKAEAALEEEKHGRSLLAKATDSINDLEAALARATSDETVNTILREFGYQNFGTGKWMQRPQVGVSPRLDVARARVAKAIKGEE